MTRKNPTILLLTLFLTIICLSGCRRRDVKYFLYYPHPVLGAIEPSANWQEFDISPLKLEKQEFLVVTFNQDERTLCRNDLSAYHLCSPAALAEYKRLSEEYRRLPVESSNFSELNRLNAEITKVVENEPLPDLRIELLTETGETEIYEPRFFGGAEGRELPFDFHECNYTAWDRAKLEAGEDTESAKYSDAENKAHARKCEESQAKTFVKIRVLSPTRMNVESIKLDNYYTPFSVR